MLTHGHEVEARVILYGITPTNRSAYLHAQLRLLKMGGVTDLLTEKWQPLIPWQRRLNGIGSVSGIEILDPELIV